MPTLKEIIQFLTRKIDDDALETGIIRYERLEETILTSLIQSSADEIARAVVSGGVMMPENTTFRMEFGVIRQLYLTVKSLVLFGDAFYEKNGTNLLWIPTGSIDYEYEGGELHYYIQSIEGRKEISKDKIVHFQMPENDLKGKGVLHKLSSEIYLDKYMLMSLISYYKNAMYPRYLIGLQDANREEIKNIEMRMADLFYSAPNGIMLINKKPEKVELKSDLPIEETMKLYEFLAKRISAVVGIPLYRLGIGNFDEAQERKFYREVVRVYQEIIEETLWKQAKFQIEFLPQAKGLVYLSELVDAVQNGILTPNEARHILGLPPVESDGADDLILITPKGKEDLGEGGEE
jgi:hypothetical protein